MVIGNPVTAVFLGIKNTCPKLFEIYGGVSLTGVPARTSSRCPLRKNELPGVYPIFIRDACPKDWKSESAMKITYLSGITMTENFWRSMIIALSALVIALTVWCLSHGITTIFMHL